LQYPAWALNNALYLLGGVRGVEIGSVMFGLQPAGTEHPAAMELVRLAFPRRVYTQSHVDYLAEVTLEAYAQRETLRGYRSPGRPPPCATSPRSLSQYRLICNCSGAFGRMPRIYRMNKFFRHRTHRTCTVKLS
jgi:hypothetical protein